MPALSILDTEDEVTGGVDAAVHGTFLHRTHRKSNTLLGDEDDGALASTLHDLH